MMHSPKCYIESVQEEKFTEPPDSGKYLEKKDHYSGFEENRSRERFNNGNARPRRKYDEADTSPGHRSRSFKSTLSPYAKVFIPGEKNHVLGKETGICVFTFLIAKLSLT